MIMEYASFELYRVDKDLRATKISVPDAKAGHEHGRRLAETGVIRSWALLRTDVSISPNRETRETRLEAFSGHGSDLGRMHLPAGCVSNRARKGVRRF